ncbi:oxamate carbamoyltransferase subunit AllH family protein [Actinocorallia populi]|uniref:oxamate carbamoyltransferase subunit AllH family protein n=1 Tax=Actinocorallia populi TaxID=2079200 RepID=UPI001E2CD36E|nr:DUF2877 domain-containing protein [Actinocorallia populi]
MIERSESSLRGPQPVAPDHGPEPFRAPVPGAAGLAVREALERPRRQARVIAVFPAAAYLRLNGGAEPRVVALVGPDGVRPANSIVVPGTGRQPFHGVREGDTGWIGDGHAEAGGLRVRVRRWWDPRPVLGPLSEARLRHGAMLLEAALDPRACGLSGHPGPAALADGCAAGDLARAVQAAERIVGLGPGLTPSGDDVISGLLLSLRLLGEVTAGGSRSVWLADWLGAAVTTDADTRTTSLSASLLHCAAAGQPSGEAAAVLRGLAGREALAPAVRRLVSSSRYSGADMAWGMLAGCRAVLALGRAPSRLASA